MKDLKTFRWVAVVLIASLLLSQTSCVVFVKKDNGKHKGWFKNPHNPHNPASTNPGKAKGNPGGKSPGNSKSKGKK